MREMPAETGVVVIVGKIKTDIVEAKIVRESSRVLHYSKPLQTGISKNPHLLLTSVLFPGVQAACKPQWWALGRYLFHHGPDVWRIQEDKVQTEYCKSFCTHPIWVPSPRTLEAASETRVCSVHCLNRNSYVVPEVFTHNIENEGFQRQFFPTQFQGRGRGNRHRLVQWPAKILFL